MRPARGRGTFALTSAAAVAGLLVAVSCGSTARASYDPVGSGTATITLDRGFKSSLDRAGVKVTGRKGARVNGRSITLPVGGGEADPTIEKAELALAGELALTRERLHVNVRALTLLTKPTPIQARVSGGQLKFAKASGVRLVRDGFGNILRAQGLRLTTKAATRLDKKLGTDVFEGGQALGSLRSTSQPSTLTILPAGKVTLTLDPAIVAKLTALSVSVNPIFPAEHQGPVFTFPIDLGSQLAPEGRGGTLRTAGSMELLRLGQGQLFWKEPWFDFGASGVTSEEDLEPVPAFPGALGRLLTFDFSIPAGGFTTDPATRTLSVSGAAVALPATTAELFNRAFAEGRSEFGAGETLGTVSFRTQAQ